MNPIDQIKLCIESDKNFVLQGGAGSGKTEALKQVLDFISETYPDKNIVCITHTNLAADEIASRVECNYTISTIHSFLNNLIKDFKLNIHQVISQLFKLDTVKRLTQKDFSDEKLLKIAEHDNYKKTYIKYAKLLFKVSGASIKKVVGKTDYEKQQDIYNIELNSQIEDINVLITTKISEQDYRKITYNETPFDSLKDLSYGHDGLLKVTSLLFSKYPLLPRVVQDKFDCIFIDEFQDTHPDIIDIFLNKLDESKNTTIGLFGDSMQGIYEDGIGDVDLYISNKSLLKIPKLDNFRCSEQVIDYLNYNRVPIDNLKQDIALKSLNGVPELLLERQGSVKVYYSIYPSKRPNTFSNNEDKDEYQNTLMTLIENAEVGNPSFKKLMLTNKSIAKKIGFSTLFQVFNDRHTEVNNQIELCLEKLNISNLAELCLAFKNENYNFVITELKKSGFIINSINDKSKVRDLFETLSGNNISLNDALDIGMKNNLIKKSETYNYYIKNKDKFLLECSTDVELNSFKAKYFNDCHTFAKLLKKYPGFFDEDIEYTGKEEIFLKFERLLKKERFYEQLFSGGINFIEIIKFYEYMGEKTDYITMHKTKGSGIDNVLVTLDDCFWSKYQFKTLFEAACEKQDMKLKMQKLFYVACSRAKKKLICVRLLTQDEEADFKASFPKFIKITKV
jgi:DNA helicase-2/ATP-dependent DNA helicase PcrA